MNPQWTERSLLDDIQALLSRLEGLAEASDRASKHSASFLKQMVKAKRDQLATLRHQRKDD